MWLLHLILFALSAACFALGNNDLSVFDDTDYAFYYPFSMVSNQQAEVCLEINKNLLPVRVMVAFDNNTWNGSTCGCHTSNSDFSCWKIDVPIRPTNMYTPSTINVKIVNDNIHLKITGQKQVQIHSASTHVFLETDRKVYKLGDTVKLRFLAIGNDLKPAKNYQVPSLQVRTPYPTAATVVLWENITISLGLAHKELQLAPDAPEGIWSITGGGIYTSFIVEKYILPRFEVTLDGPTTIHKVAQNVSYTICGKYSYGRSMKGVALLKIEGTRLRQQEPSSFSRIKDLSLGCAKFDVFLTDFDFKSISYMKVTGSITEEGTGQTQSKDTFASVVTEPYSYRWENLGRFYKPELPYIAKLILTDVTVSLLNADIQICYESPLLEILGCSNFTLRTDNSIEFTIPPIKNHSLTRNLQIVAKVIQQPLSYPPTYYLTVWHSASKSAIKIVDTKPNPKKCGTTLKYTVLYTSQKFAADEVAFKYILSSRGKIVSRGKILRTPTLRFVSIEDYPNVVGGTANVTKIPVDTFNIEIKLNKQIFTKSKLLVYYDHDNEIISDTIDIDLETCSPNKVRAKWLKSPLYPGENGKLNIQADPESLCSISSIDKASTFLGSSERISIDYVFNALQTYAYLNDVNCIMPPKLDEPLNKRYRRYGGSGFDSYEAFRDSNIGVITNMKYIVKICEEMPDIMFAKAETTHIPESTAGNSRGSEVRSFFPETWLWDLVVIDNDGQTIVERKLPDSITDWEGNVICASSNNGFGISNKIEMKGWKPFFVDVLLPYSIKRNKEILHLPVPIFNYLNHSLPIRITLINNGGILLVDGTDKDIFNICLAAQDSYTHNYRIKATQLGYINITVSAAVDTAYVRNCIPPTIIPQRDTVQRSLLVEPEGYPSKILKSALLCTKGTTSNSTGTSYVKWKIELPENVVPDTINGRVSINSDILGPMFQNLENILVVPTGCGEQTMATLTPNLYALKYLQANNALTQSTKIKILKNLEIGYQRMLNYVHDDGSFSAFGKTDKGGSMFLTAFVIRTLKQIKNYIYIDDVVISKAVKWIISHQLQNGCFDPVNHVLHEMGIASSKNQTTALTSYVIISFLESSTKIDDNVLAKAKECITSDSTIDKYTMAISSYALGLLGITTAVTERLAKLLELSNNKDGSTWWTQSENSQSANVETSSYVLISLIQQDPTKNLGIGSSIVRWLQTQINPTGGFYSTVDTVVGLDAISRYSALVNNKEPHVKISITTKDQSKDFEIHKRDRTKTHILPLTSYPNQVEAKIEGDGCVALQTTVNYFIDSPTAATNLRLSIESKPFNPKDKCSLIELKPCVSYANLGEINMAIVKVAMPSGYAPDQASLYELISKNIVKKFEVPRNEVVIYLTKVGNNQVCMPFKIERKQFVENAASATVEFYDYYKPELLISKNFKLEDC